MCVGKGMQRSLVNSYTLARSCECLTLKWAMSSRLGPGMQAFHEILIHTISVHVQIPCHVTLLLCGSKGLTRKSLLLTSKGRKHFLNALFQSHDFTSMTLYRSHNIRANFHKSYQTTQEMTTSISTWRHIGYIYLHMVAGRSLQAMAFARATRRPPLRPESPQAGLDRGQQEQ